jgi:hypothetical protein
MQKKQGNKARIAALVRELLVELGEDPEREGLKVTPQRMAESLLFDRGNPALDVLDTAALRRVWSEHLGGGRDHSVFVWAVMMYALWAREHGASRPEVRRAA